MKKSERRGYAVIDWGQKTIRYLNRDVRNLARLADYKRFISGGDSIDLPTRKDVHVTIHPVHPNITVLDIDSNTAAGGSFMTEFVMGFSHDEIAYLQEHLFVDAQFEHIRDSPNWYDNDPVEMGYRPNWNLQYAPEKLRIERQHRGDFCHIEPPEPVAIRTLINKKEVAHA